VAGEALTAAREHSIMREATSYQVLGIVLIRTDLEEARRKVEWSDGIFERMGEVGARSSTAAMLADIALMMGDLERAEATIATAREITVTDDIDAVARTLAAESKLLALRGDERALVSGRRALETSEGTEYLLMRARALTLVAEAHVSLGDRETAADLHRRALAVSEEKGDVWSAARSRSALEQLGSTGPSLV
ncbi:MAG TPA: hypothetical protein VFS18_05760, partial [Actinomycetota bacterium]|nr:hypothetical protein [Actinomycetota bacterium]